MMSKTVSDQPPRAPEGHTIGSVENIERLYHMRIDRDGVWHHEGRPIARKPLVKLFATVLRREDDGDYWLVTPVERGRIEVEDAPFVITELEAAIGRDADAEAGAQTLRAKTNLDEWVTIGPDHPLCMRLPKCGPQDTPLPYVDIRPGLEARFLRPVYYQLIELGDSHHHDGTLRYGVWSAGRFFALE